MSADTQAMIDQLMSQTTVTPQQSFLGMQGPANQDQMQQLLGQLKQQQFQQQALTSSPEQFRRASMIGVGQSLGGLVSPMLQGGSFGGPSPDAQAAANAPPSPQSQMLMQARAKYASDVASGVPENDARQGILKQLISAGFPAAPDALEKAVTTGLTDSHLQAQAGHENAQAVGALDMVNTEHPATQANLIRERQQEDVRLKIEQQQADTAARAASVKASMAAGGDIDPAAMDKAASDVANYLIPESQMYGRGTTMAQKAAFHAQVVAKNGDYDLRNFKQSNDAIKAYGPAGALGQQTAKLQNAINHLGLLDQYGRALDAKDVTLANQIKNKLSAAFGGASISGYESIAPIVASEVSGALVKGGGGVEERVERSHTLGAQLSTPARNAATQGMRDLLSAQYKNYQNTFEKTTFRKNFQDMYPIAGGFSAPGSSETTAPTSAPASSGWGQASVSGK